MCNINENYTNIRVSKKKNYESQVNIIEKSLLIYFKRKS